MKLVNIVPGFGGTFYCGNCLRDSVFMNSMKESGHEAVILPIYLPLSVKDNRNREGVPVFYGAVNIYLKQNYPLFRKMPRWMENFFNSAPILKYAAKKAGSTRAEGLQEMTISMLMGKNGQQKEELQQLVDFLKNHEKPDVVHLSNALLLGLAKQIREEVNVPVVCSLQDEDVWVDVMGEDYSTKVWDLLAEKGKDVDAFIAVSDYFAKEMKVKMKIPDEKLHVVHIGINPDLYNYTFPAENPQAIGYLSRMNDENGFEILVDAFIIIKANHQFKDLKLKLSGGKTGDDEKFFRKQMQKLKNKDLLKDVEIQEDFTLEALHGFFKSLSVLTVPVIRGEAFGLYQIEALASGVPLVQPALGAFPEIVNSTGGGVNYSPNTPEALAAKWIEVLSDPERLKMMSEKGRNEVVAKFDCRKLSQDMVSVYKKVINNK